MLLYFGVVPLDILDLEPTESELEEKAVRRVAGSWEKIGRALQIEGYALEAMTRKNSSNEEHCLVMFRNWLNELSGYGALPRTWSTVLHAAETGCGHKVSQKIAELLR